MHNRTATEANSRSAPVALVTGGSRGIGAAIAQRLAADGYDIWLAYRSSHDDAARVQSGILALGRRCTLCAFDVADQSATEQALAPLLKDCTPALLVNNAGFTRDGVFAMMPPQDWWDVIRVHLGGFFHVTRLLMPHMQRRRQGQVITVTSTAGQTGSGGQVNYSAAKAGLMGATRSLAVEVGKRGVRVNAVAPGFIESDMTAALPKDRILPHIPLGRFGQPEEVAHAISFLASPDAAYITGQVLAVNGGIFM